MCQNCIEGKETYACIFCQQTRGKGNALVVHCSNCNHLVETKAMPSGQCLDCSRSTSSTDVLFVVKNGEVCRLCWIKRLSVHK